MTQQYFPYSNVLLGNAIEMSATLGAKVDQIENLKFKTHHKFPHTVTLGEAPEDLAHFRINSGAAFTVNKET
jgi:hypothetical protein